MICICSYCKESGSKSILQRIMDGCDCFLCKRKKEIPFLYYNCIELHFLNEIGFSNTKENTYKIVSEKIKFIKKEYLRKKILFLWYMYCSKKFLELFIEVQYRPGGSGYLRAMNSFYNHSNRIIT